MGDKGVFVYEKLTNSYTDCTDAGVVVYKKFVNLTPIAQMRCKHSTD